jgi:AcrR family transcriptional regulator
MQVSPDSRKSLLIKATAEVLLEKGLLAARTRDVTERSGVGTGLLNHYFRWSELRALAWSNIFEGLFGALHQGAGDPKATMERFLSESFTPQADQIWQLWLEAIDLARSDGPMAQALEVAHKSQTDALTQVLEAGRLCNCWTLKDPSDTAIRLIALHDGLAGLILTRLTDMNHATAARHLRVAFALECGGAVD